MKNVIIRPAELADVDHITAMTITLMADDEAWQHRYLHAKEFPEDHYAFTKQRILTRTQPETRGGFLVMVAEVQQATEDEKVLRPELAGYSVWHQPWVPDSPPAPLREQ